MAQQFPGGSSVLLSNHIELLTTAYNSSSRYPFPSSDLCVYQPHMAHTHKIKCVFETNTQTKQACPTPYFRPQVNLHVYKGVPQEGPTKPGFFVCVFGVQVRKKKNSCTKVQERSLGPTCWGLLLGLHLACVASFLNILSSLLNSCVRVGHTQNNLLCQLQSSAR